MGTDRYAFGSSSTALLRTGTASANLPALVQGDAELLCGGILGVSSMTRPQQRYGVFERCPPRECRSSMSGANVSAVELDGFCKMVIASSFWPFL